MFSRARSLGPGQGKRKVVMKARSLLAGLAVAVFTLAGAVSANAAPSSTGELTLVGKGAIYKEAQRPVDLTLDVAVTPEQGALTLKPLANVTVKFPVGLDLVADGGCRVEILGPERGGQAVAGVVHEVDRLGVVASGRSDRDLTHRGADRSAPRPTRSGRIALGRADGSAAMITRRFAALPRPPS